MNQASFSTLHYIFAAVGLVLTFASCEERPNSKMVKTQQEIMIKKVILILGLIVEDEGSPPKTLDPIVTMENIQPEDAPHYLNYFDPITNKRAPWDYFPENWGLHDKLVLTAPFVYEMNGESRRLVAWGDRKVEWILSGK